MLQVYQVQFFPQHPVMTRLNMMYLHKLSHYMVTSLYSSVLQVKFWQILGPECIYMDSFNSTMI